MLFNKRLNKMVKDVASDLGYKEEVVAAVYSNYFRFMDEVFGIIPAEDITTEEELTQYRTSVNLPKLGKFYIDLQNINKVKKLRKIHGKHLKNQKRDDSQNQTNDE